MPAKSPEIWAELAASLKRYEPILDDARRFWHSLQTPLPVCLWGNPIKTQEALLEEILSAMGVVTEPVLWYPGALRSFAWDRPGATVPYMAGWYYLQEEIAMTAVLALDPQPGDWVLDLCAAPGGKAAQIALKLRETGGVVANDFKTDRLPALSTNLARLGLTNTWLSQQDGRHLNAFLPQSFDRVLVDAPCSGEGRWRWGRRPMAQAATYRQWIATIQRQLLQHALSWVKPGGIVVYSTCTYAPEENEAVLEAVLADQGVIEPVTLAGLKAAPGLSAWAGQSFRADMVNAHRYWPHLNQTGGFFLAKIRRTDQELVVVPDILEDERRSALEAVPIEACAEINWLRQRFGLSDEALAPFRVWTKDHQKFWLMDRSISVTPGIIPQRLGLPIVQRQRQGLKPTTVGLQRLGPWLTRNVIDLPTEAAAKQFIQGQDQVLTAQVQPGFVHVRYGVYQLGCGIYRHGRLVSQIPKTLRPSFR